MSSGSASQWLFVHNNWNSEFLLFQAKMDFVRTFLRKHEEIKKRVHSFRVPLSPAGQRLMSMVYFSIPVVAGYFIMQVSSDMSDCCSLPFAMKLLQILPRLSHITFVNQLSILYRLLYHTRNQI